MLPKLTIIIPVYNSERTIKRCIDSIVSQDFSDYELILVDDGSLDSSGKICDSIAITNRNVKVLHKVNGGASSARNIGIEIASGEWVTFIDSDDYIEPGYLDIDLKSDSNLQVQNWKMFGGAKVKEEKLERRFIDTKEMPSFCAQNLHLDIFRMVSCKFYRLDIIRKNDIRFQTGCILGEDTLFMMEYMPHVNTINIVDSGNYMYWRQENWGTKYNLAINDIIQYLSLFVNRYKKLPYKCLNLLSFVFTWYTNLIPNFSRRKTKLQWYTAPPNLYIQRQLCLKRGKKFFIRYICCVLLSYIINPFHPELHRK